MLRLLFAAALALTCFCGMAQDTTDQCATPDMDTTEFANLPWFDNNQYLDSFLNAEEYPFPGSSNTNSRIVSNGIRYWIPVRFIIYRNDAGISGPTLREVRDLMDNLNRLYNVVNNTGIAFYLKCSPQYINNSQHVNKTGAGANILMETNNDAGCVNVHIVNSIGTGGLI